MEASEFERVDRAAAVVRARCRELPTVAIVLGSGLGDFADTATESVAFDYGALPHWPQTRVEGHRDELVIGRIEGRQTAVLAGRVHAYEGYSLIDVVFATRVMARLGVRQLILTNAAGGINPALAAGTLMAIDDHLNLLGGNPLAGPNDARFGPRFPDLTAAYSLRLRTIADEASRALQIPLAHGIYAAVSGPSYETPAEVRYLRTIGADAVGMSTVPETIAARHMGMEVLGISCITNMAAGVTSSGAADIRDASSGHELTHEDVLATAHRVRETFGALLQQIIGMM
jgi:purine-nucleoside phosphorylase